MELISKPHRYLLFLRFLLANIVALALLLAAWLQGWLDGIFVPVTMELSLGIFIVFLFSLFTCGKRIWQTSIELNDIRSGDPKEGSRAAKYLATIYGGGADRAGFPGPDWHSHWFHHRVVRCRPGFGDGNRQRCRDVATLINGMSVALYTTLVGAVLYVWLIINHRLLTSGVVSLIGAIIELGEARERA